MDNSTTIRPIEKKDAAAIAKILRSLDWFDYIQAESPATTIDRVQRHIALSQADVSHTLLVAETDDGVVVGYAAVHWLPYLFLPGPEGYLSELFVDERHRGRKIGQRLLRTIMTEAGKRNCARLMLITSRSRESYQRGFYLKQGWTERENVAPFVLYL